MSNAGRRLILFCATGAGSGYVPVAPGTAGTAVAVVLFFLLSSLSLSLYLLTTARLYLRSHLDTPIRQRLICR